MSVKAHLRLLPTPTPDAPALREIVSVDDLFREFAPVVARLGLRMLGRPHEVDDLVQDVFLDVHLGQASLRDVNALRSWVYTIAIRHVRRRLRARRLRQWVGLDEVSDYSRLNAGDASAEERATLAAVYRILDRIPVDARTAWQLRYVEGETLPRVAELCGCSRATAHRRIVAAQVAIDEEMGDG